MLPDIDFDQLPALLHRVGDRLSEESVAELGTALTAATSSADPVTAATFVATTACVGLLQDKTVELGGRLDQEITDRIEELDEEGSRTATVQVALLRRIAASLPDGDQWDHAIVQSANGDPDDLIELLEMYANDSKQRRQLENTVGDIFEGEVDLNEEEDFIEYLCERFEVDDRNKALTTFLDVSDLLTSREVHEAVGRLADIKADLNAVKEAVDGGRERIHRSLDRDLRSEGIHRVTDAYIRTQPSKTPTEAWATGMNLRQIIRQEQNDRDYGVERPVIFDADPDNEWAVDTDDGGRLTPDDIVDGLAAGRNLLVRGKPGSGKSVICRLAINAWRNEDSDTRLDTVGTVFYRPSGGTPFTEPGLLVGAIEEAEKPTLVVVEDAARSEVQGLYDMIAMNNYLNDDSVALLLNARYGEWSDFNPFESGESDLSQRLKPLMESLPKARPAPLDAAECGRIVDHYEALTNQEVPLPGDDAEERGVTLYERIETDSQAGEMLHLTSLVAGGEGLQADALAKASAIERPEKADNRTSLNNFDSELVRHAGLLTALLGATGGQQFRREYLFALADTLSNAPIGETYAVEDVDKLLADAFDGWLVFDGTNRRRYQTYHEYWSFLFIRALLGHKADESQSVDVSTSTLHERFTRCMRATLALQTGTINEGRAQKIRRRVSDLDRTVFDEIVNDPGETVTEFIKNIYGVGTDYPLLAPMYRDPDVPALDLDDVGGVPTEAVARATISTGRMYARRGELDIARNEFEQCGELIAGTESAYSELEHERQYRLTRVLQTEGQFDAAETMLKESYDRLSSSSDDHSAVLADICREIGWVRQNRGDLDGAEEWYKRGQNRGTDRLNEAAAVTGLGNVKGIRKNHHEAERLHRQSLEIRREIGDKAGEASSLNNLGLAEKNRGNLKEAERLHRQSLEIKREIGDKAGESGSLNNLGLVERSREKLKEAERLHRQSLDIKREIGDKAGEANCLNNLGLVEEDRENLPSAAKKFETAACIRTEIGAVGDALTSFSNLHGVAEKMDDADRTLGVRDTVFDLVRESEDWALQAADLSKLLQWFLDRVPSKIPQPTDRVRDLHYLGCCLIAAGQYDDGKIAEAVAWELRKEFNPGSDDHAVALAAGTGVLTLLQYLDNENANMWKGRVLDTIRDSETPLSQGAAALFEYLDTGETDTNPDELRAFADHKEGPELERQEARAFAHLLELFAGQ